MSTFTLNLKPMIELTDEQFFQLCQHNRDARFERSSEGELIIMPPTGGETSRSNARLTYQLTGWAESTGSGIVFDSSGGFKLPNGADRSPDAAWISQERWDALSTVQKERFVPLCPDFAVEILSPSDRLSITQAKMNEYIENGLKLGWLINRKEKEVEIYRPNQEVEVLRSPETLSGESVLQGFVLQLSKIW